MTRPGDRRVVIIDDSEDDRAELRRLLLRGSDRRYHFVEAPTAAAGVAAILDEPGHLPDCVLLDYVLASDDAVSVLDRLGGPDDGTICPVVVVTGYTESDRGAALLRMGAQDYLSKRDLTAGNLTRAVDNAIHRWTMARDLREVERRYRDIVEAMTEGLAVLDPEGRLTFVNGACLSIFGYEHAEQMRGRPLAELMAASELPPPGTGIGEHLLAGGRDAARRVLRFHARSGQELLLSLGAMRLERRGAPGGVLCIFTDVTAARNLELKLQQAQKLESLGVLAGGIAHDFNNLLVGILGNAGLARTLLPPASPALAEIDGIETAAMRAAELTRQLLAYAGKARFVTGRIDLRRLVEEMGNLLAAVIGKGVALRYQFDGDAPWVEGDATQLRQVVMNLITNASDAIGAATGVIQVSTRHVEAGRAELAASLLADELPAGRYVCLEVADTGAGMAPETVQKIFDPFFTTKFTGRGLGLAAVLGIVRAHRGAIQVRSELGRGTTFKMLLPAAEAPAVPEHAPGAAGEPAGAEAPAELILVVDDEEMVRYVTQRVLTRAGYRVLTASDGVDGVELFRERWREIALVILDVTMPRMGGEEAFREMRQIDPDVRALLASGYSGQDTPGPLAGEGLAGFVEKPFRPQALVEQVRRAIHDRRRVLEGAP